VVQLGRSVTADAFDERFGKWLYSGDPIRGTPSERISNIWTNFEAANGLFTLWELTGEQAYLEKLGRVLRWLATRQRNPITGEWFYNVDDAGRPVDTDVFGNACGWMTFEWKSSYHAVRALLSIERRARALTQHLDGA
jgi:mannose/cellobiose epimerase-like protein (N-acyl-D-glucosamine 2-epimerase family)